MAGKQARHLIYLICSSYKHHYQVMDELDFFIKLNHPNCHYLLGAKTTLDNGGILVRLGRFCVVRYQC